MKKQLLIFIFFLSSLFNNVFAGIITEPVSNFLTDGYEIGVKSVAFTLT